MAYLLVSLAVVGAVFFSSLASSIPFDAAYNLLPYKNMIESGRFEHRYGDLITPFPPAVSTGPTVNLPIAAGYAVWHEPEAFFVTTAVTVAGFWALFLAVFFVLERRGKPLHALLLLLPLLSRHTSALEQWLLVSALGEFPSVHWYAPASPSDVATARATGRPAPCCSAWRS